jgi:excisionase family DNA binding protein
MPTEKPERWWLDAGEVAELFGVHAKTVKRWIIAGAMKGHKATTRGHYRVLVFNIHKFVKTNPEYDFIWERFRERYQFASVLRQEDRNQGGTSDPDGG